ncbi:Uncharacterized protein SCF082_LOCUS4848, partial [Durusdinium trenchii]
VENPLRLAVDRPPRVEIDRYRRARSQQALYRAAARLCDLMGKRKSGATDAPGGGKASKKTMELPSIPAADMKKQDSETWHCVFRSLSAWQLVQDTAIKFYQFVEKEFPPDPSLSLPQRMCRKTYATESAFHSSEVQKALALNMMYRGCITDPNAPGSEKVVVASVNDKWLQEPRMHISSMEIGAEDKLLSPQAAFAVKGWNRSVAALLILRAACELGEDFTALRRRPNAFNFLHQCEMLLANGVSGDSAIEGLHSLENASAFASAYQVGKLEAGACTNLLTQVSTEIRTELKELVRIFGQPKFVLHDGIAAGIFNKNFNPVGNGDPWNIHLQNTPELLTLLLSRMRQDFEGMSIRMRKPFGQKELDPWLPKNSEIMNP